MGAFVYILRCSDKSLYIGCANNLERRIAQHQAGTFTTGYTALRRPVELVWSEHFERITDAIAAERQIKGWSKAKKEALIRGEWALVQQLARRRAGKPRPDPSS
jgi:putative endonuclease